MAEQEMECRWSGDRAVEVAHKRRVVRTTRQASSPTKNKRETGQAQNIAATYSRRGTQQWAAGQTPRYNGSVAKPG
ncbi:hypothetical protein CC86DRAFT_39594 [Ophiobolus disseminans]|uniref:Uncharacterized protein n=1 Tax=Ophiobolus disseminans TaxID=1469910 RepID=A0A6A6ZWC9_9PLEO|nr:hypothetical protein CC86DRAFT_39594 [Ophiobolus disseminans]